MDKKHKTDFLLNEIAQLQEKLERSEKRENKYRTIFEKSTDAILIISNRIFIDCNQATVDLLGYGNKEQFLNVGPSSLSPPNQASGKESNTEANEMMDLAVKNGSQRFEWIHLKENGDKFSVEVLLTTISAQENDEVFYTIWRDISEYKKAQEQTQTSERRFQMLMQQSPSVIELYNKEGLQISVNTAYEDLWDLPAEATVGKFNVLLSEEVRKTGLLEYVKKAYAGEVAIVPEFRFDPTGEPEAVGKGRIRWLSSKIYPIKDISGDVEHIVITHEDVTQKRKALDELKYSEERFRSLVETTSDFIWEIDNKGFYTYASPNVTSILGYEAEEVIGKTPIDFMQDFEKKKIGEIFNEISAKRLPFDHLENINQHKNGSLVIIETSGVPFFNEQNEFAGYHGIDRNITSRKTYENQLLLTESVFTNSIEGIAITDNDGTIEKVNNAFTDITGYSPEEAVGQNPRILKSDRHDDLFYKEMWKNLIDIGQWSGEIWNRKKDGSVYPEWLSIAAIKKDTGETTHYTSVFHDISEKKLNEEKLEFLAYHDPLTRLPNRRLFYDRFKVSLATAKRYGTKVALLYMDIDNFKDINDSYGHPFGDIILCKVKDKLESICRKSDTIARYGGDEFVILLNNIHSNYEALEFSHRLINLFKIPIIIDNEEVFTSLSIGLSTFPDDGGDIVTLEKNADIALYRAKQEGKMQAFLFRQDLKDEFMRRSYLGKGIRKSIGDFSSFHLLYQPKVDSRTRKIIGVEALLRWKLDGVLVSPMEFIPIAEETNTIVALGEWVMNQAMTDIKDIHDTGNNDISLSVNLSAKQFKDGGLFTSVEEAIEKTGFDHSHLMFEITESVPTNNIDQAIKIMEKLQTMGIHLSMDDFGTGYSSLSYLKKFPLRELKIDRSFIADIPDDQNDVAISRTIINMAKSLDFDVVAEGVETEQQLTFLQEHECYLIQGYFFYKPLTIDELRIALFYN